MVESTSTKNLFPKKPARANGAAGKSLKLYSNYFQIDFDSKDIQGVNKYTCKFEPEIPENSRKVRKDVLKVVRDTIKEKLEFFIIELKKIFRKLQWSLSVASMICTHSILILYLVPSCSDS